MLCSMCGFDRAEDRFYKRSDRKSGYASGCKDCRREKYAKPRMKARRDAGLCWCGRTLNGKARCESCRASQGRSQAKRAIRLKKDGTCVSCKRVPATAGVHCQPCSDKNGGRRHKISAAEYSERRLRSCEICGDYVKPGKSGGGMHIDHDHKTGTLRGTLCEQCNRGLGCLGDSSSKLRAAALYLEKYVV